MIRSGLDGVGGGIIFPLVGQVVLDLVLDGLLEGWWELVPVGCNIG